MTKEFRTILIQIGLFIATFISSTLAGAEFCFGKLIYRFIPETNSIGINTEFSLSDFMLGMQFSIPFLLILTVHEFGHYFTALYHKVKSSLPYYLPLPPIPFFPSFIGTFGAVIRLRSKIHSNLQNFDIGLAGPLAGFIVALVVLFIGFTTLPPAEEIFIHHPEYKEFGLDYANHVYTDQYIREHQGGVNIYFGNNLLYEFLGNTLADPQRLPNPHEIMHFPMLMAGFIALFFTALNLLPIGQLDGGHIIYGLFGRKGHSLVASVFFVILIFYAGLGAVNFQVDKSDTFSLLFFNVPALAVLIPFMLWFNYYAMNGLGLSKRDTMMYAFVMFAIQFTITAFFPTVEGYRGWMVFGFIIGRFIGVHHPPAEIELPLDTKRIILGWLMLIVFVISFSPSPIVIEILQPLK